MSRKILAIDQGSEIFGVTPSDTTEFDQAVLFVGTEGDVTVVARNGGTETFKDYVGWLPVQVTQVLATGTTATNIVGVR